MSWESLLECQGKHLGGKKPFHQRNKTVWMSRVNVIMDQSPGWEEAQSVVMSSIFRISPPSPTLWDHIPLSHLTLHSACFDWWNVRGSDVVSSRLGISKISFHLRVCLCVCTCWCMRAGMCISQPMWRTALGAGPHFLPCLSQRLLWLGVPRLVTPQSF